MLGDAVNVGLGGAAPYWLSWTFDKTGNRLTQRSHASAGDTVNSFTYPAAGAAQPHTVSKIAWELLKDISGWNDIVDCFTKGDVWACGGLVMNLVPWGKVGRVLEAGYKAVRATVTMAKVIEKAQGLLRRVEKITAAAEEIAVKAMQKVGGKADDFGGSCPVRHSFVAGTRVLMADGSSKPIDQMQVGDKVKATDPASGEISDREVVATIVHTDEGDMTRLSVAGGTIDATSWHPVWVEERGDFAKIGDLKVGEHLRSPDGALPVVVGIQRYAQIQPVYDLTIDGVHTYHVLVGDKPVLVHNCGTGGADFVADANGTVVPTSQSRMADGLDEAGFPSSPTSSAGTQYELPDGTKVRLMEPSGQAPRRASFTNANDGPISPFTGRPVQPPAGLSKAERKEYIRERTHVEQTP